MYYFSKDQAASEYHFGGKKIEPHRSIERREITYHDGHEGEVEDHENQIYLPAAKKNTGINTLRFRFNATKLTYFRLRGERSPRRRTDRIECLTRNQIYVQ